MTDSSSTAANRGLLLGVALVSAATLGVQVLQTRLFSVMLWHHLTYMVVTVTLLGFGAAGSLLAVFPRLARPHGSPAVAVSACCSLFGLTLIGAFVILAHSPLDTLDIEKDRTKYFYLFAHYAYLVVPFVFAGLAVAIALHEYRRSVHRTYFWNLLGSGIGSLLFLALIRPLGGPGSLFLFATLGGIGGLTALWGQRKEHSTWPVTLLALMATAIWPASCVWQTQFDRLVPITPARSKAETTFRGLYQAIRDYYQSQDPTYPDADPKLFSTHWTPTCRLDTVPIPPTPADAKRDREEPGTGPRSQVHVFQDGDAPTVIWSGQYAAERGYDKHFYGLGYRLVKEPNVLVIGPGGGNDVETALHWGARKVTAVDINGDTLKMVESPPFKDYTHDVYGRDKVTPINSEGRSYLRRSGQTFDLIQMSGTDTYAALASGSYIFSESYLYTREAFDDFFAHLADDGVMCIIRFRFEPPRETLKLVATAAGALRRLGIEDPRNHFIVVNQEDRQAMLLSQALAAHASDRRYREAVDAFKVGFKEPLRYSLTLMRKKPFSAEDVEKIAGALPGMSQTDVVRHSLYYGAGYSGQDTEYGKLLAAMASHDEATFYRDYRYEVAPATDDKPFFFNFESFSDIKLFGSSSDAGYEALTGSEPIGLYILAALMLQTAIATLLLVVLPLFKLGFKTAGGVSRSRTMVYFLALGLAYLLVEITTIQRFVLYLGHPSYSLSAGLCSFLVFSGLGSATAGRLGAGRRGAAAAAIAVVAMLAVHAAVLPQVLRDTLAFDEASRVAMTVAWIAPLAFAMGMPFPTGLRLLGQTSPGLLPWAFGVNGAASVLASILSIVIAMQAGFVTVFAIAGLLYLLAAMTVPRVEEEPSGVREVEVPAT